MENIESELKPEESKEDSPKTKPSYERKMYQGSWKCADCGKEITELPFIPDRSVYCQSCYRNRKQNF